MQNIHPPTTRKQLHQFVGLINYYSNMWWHHSDMLAPLTRLTSINMPYKWTEVKQKAFENMKKIISRDVYLAYPDFNKYFDIHMDASDLRLGACISQD